MNLAQLVGGAGGIAGAASLAGFVVQWKRERRAGREQAVRLPLSVADEQVDLVKEVNEFVRDEMKRVHAELERVRVRSIEAEQRAESLERELRQTQRRLASTERELHAAQCRIEELETAGEK